MEALKFVIVGHVDHGKSTLIGRLLYDTNSLPSDKIEEIERVSREFSEETEFAYLLDHLEEERLQGITIDTTQVFFKTEKRQYVIIDAPGHVEFVKNMVTGASQADAAVLIIDVKEGIKEQTRRHAYIVSLLGLKQVIVVLNKMDLVSFSKGRFDGVKEEIKKFLDSINIEAIFYIPISAMKGDNIVNNSTNMDWYKGPAFLESLNTLKGRGSDEDKPLIFPVQDVYKIDSKRIIVGRIETGVIETGFVIRILPGNETTRVQSVERFLERRDKAYAGESIGITTQDAAFINRGNVLCLPGKEPVLTDRFYASIFWMAKQDFTRGERITIRCATQETTCVIDIIKEKINSSTLEVLPGNGDVLKNLEVGEVIIKAKKPIAIKPFNDVRELGRFVLVQDGNISAGGIVTGF